MADLSILRRATAQTMLRPATQTAPKPTLGTLMRQFAERYSRYEDQSRRWLESRFDVSSRLGLGGQIARYPVSGAFSTLNMTLRNLRRRPAQVARTAEDHPFTHTMPELPVLPGTENYQPDANDLAYEDFAYSEDSYSQPETSSASYVPSAAPEYRTTVARLGDFQPLTMRNLFAVESSAQATPRMEQLQVSTAFASNGASATPAPATSLSRFAETQVSQKEVPVAYRAETPLARAFERINEVSDSPSFLSSVTVPSANSESTIFSATAAGQPAQISRSVAESGVANLPSVQRVGQQWVVNLPSESSSETVASVSSNEATAAFPTVPMSQIQRTSSTAAVSAANREVATASQAQISSSNWVANLGSLRHNPATSTSTNFGEARQLESNVARLAAFEPVVLQNLSSSTPSASTTRAGRSTVETFVPLTPAPIAPVSANPSPLMRAFERAEINTGADTTITAPTGNYQPLEPAYLQAQPQVTVQAQTPNAALAVGSVAQVARVAAPSQTDAVNPSAIATQVARSADYAGTGDAQGAAAAESTPLGYGLHNQIQRFNSEKISRSEAALEISALQHNPGVTAFKPLAENNSQSEAATASSSGALNMTVARLAAFGQPGLQNSELEAATPANEAATATVAQSVTPEVAPAVARVAESQIGRFASEKVADLDSAFDLSSLRYNPGAALNAAPAPANVSRTLQPSLNGEAVEAQASYDLEMTQARLANYAQPPRSQPVAEAASQVARSVSPSPSAGGENLRVMGLEYGTDSNLRPTAGNLVSDMSVQRMAEVENLLTPRPLEYEKSSQNFEVVPGEVAEVDRRYIMPPLAMARAREATAPTVNRTPENLWVDNLPPMKPLPPAIQRQTYPTNTDFPHLNQVSRFVNDRSEISVRERNDYPLNLITQQPLNLISQEADNEKKDLGYAFESVNSVNLNAVQRTPESVTPSRTSVLMSQAALLANEAAEAAPDVAAPRFNFLNSATGASSSQAAIAAPATVARTAAKAVETNGVATASAAPTIARSHLTPVTAAANAATNASVEEGAWSSTNESTEPLNSRYAAAEAEPAHYEPETFHPTAWIQRKVASVSSPTVKPTTLMAKVNTIMRTSVGQQIESNALTRMNRMFNYNFEPVRVHTNHEVGQVVREVGAEAFTVGSNIYFAPGRYQPDSPTGQALLGHELTHVVQQASLPSLGGGRVPEVSSQGQAMEHEAQHNENMILRHLESSHSSPTPQTAATRLTTVSTPHAEPERDSLTEFANSSIMRSFEPVHLHSTDNRSDAQGDNASHNGSSNTVQRSVDGSSDVQRFVATPEGYQPGQPTDNLTRKHLEMITEEVVRRLRHELMVERERHGANSRRFF